MKPIFCGGYQMMHFLSQNEGTSKCRKIFLSFVMYILNDLNFPIEKKWFGPYFVYNRKQRIKSHTKNWAYSTFRSGNFHLTFKFCLKIIKLFANQGSDYLHSFRNIHKVLTLITKIFGLSYLGSTNSGIKFRIEMTILVKRENEVPNDLHFRQ